jgi:threonine dehydrogenase-like Zn-dependent dehydrogenase
MVRPGSSTAGKTAAVVGAATAIGIIAVLSIALFADSVVALREANATRLASAADRQSAIVNRENKTNALPAPQTSPQRIPIKTVEVVGIRNAAIVYRDRDGNVLFRTDPVANVTVVAKNVDLPEVTIRDTAATQVKRMPVERAEPGEQPQGCESAFARPAPVALTRLSSRCLAQLGATKKFAAID